MIGTFIRSTHHLERSGGYLHPIKLMAIRCSGVIDGEMVVGKDNRGRKKYYFFQNVNNNIDTRMLREFCDGETEKVVSKLLNKYPRCTMFNNLDELRSFGTQFLMLPTDFDDLYNNFLKQNKKVIAPIFNKYCDQQNSISKLMFAICESGNYFAWAMKCFYNSRITIMTIYRIMLWKDKYSQLVSKLNNKTITAYNNTSSVLALLKECSELRKNKRANDIVNMFNTEQKKMLKENFKSLPMDVLNKFSILSKVKQQNFIRKVSTITDLDELLRLMAFTTSQHFKWSKAAFLEYVKNVEGLNCKIILENETSVLVEVYDYETIKKLAKTTNWCISKNKSYWNNYTGRSKDATQYVLFDFSKKEDDELSIVGFTTIANKGITHAHSFTNADLMTHHDDMDDAPYEGVLKDTNVRNSIYAVIANNNIPLSLVTKFASHFPIWTKAAFIDSLNKAIGKDNYTIYDEEDDKIVISTTNFDGIIALLGKCYLNKFSDCYRDCEHIFFANFSQNANDNNKLNFAIVTSNSRNKSYRSANDMYNEFGIKYDKSFNTILSEYHLPYDIICRPNTIKHRFMEALMNHDIKEIEALIDEKEIREMIMSKYNNEIKKDFKQELILSIQGYNSVELLNLIEKHGYSIINFITPNDVRSVLFHFYNGCCSVPYTPTHFGGNKEQTLKELENGFVNGWNGYRKTYVLNYYFFNRILSAYKKSPITLKAALLNVGENIARHHYGGVITDEVINLMLDVFPMDKYINIYNNMISVIFSNNITSCIDKLLSMDITNEMIRSYILHYASSHYSNQFKKKWGMKIEEPKVEQQITSEKGAFSVYSSPLSGAYTIDPTMAFTATYNPW